MHQLSDTVFDAAVWEAALDKSGSVVQMSVVLYGADAQMVCRPMPASPIAALFEKHGYQSEIVADCVRACLAQPADHRPPVVVSAASGLAAVGVSLVLEGRVVGAVVAAYAVATFSESVAIARLARIAGIPFHDLWGVVRRLQPVPVQRLVQHGELLQVLGDTLLRENLLRRRSDETARQLSHAASHDPLTNLPNRLLLGDRLVHALALARRHQRRMAVLFLDIDRFKQINDSLGHLLGDELLHTVGRELTRCVRSSDTVSRQGGDEFVVVLSELAHADDAGRAAANIIAAVARPRRIAGHDLRVTVSVGISVFPDDGDNAETLLTCADMALYEAKDRGRNGYRFFEPGLSARAGERLSIEAGLRKALDQQEFELFYQPKMNLKAGGIVGAEALIRWRHPGRGLVEPAQFVPVAEDCGLIEPIGLWVLHEACRQAKAWQDAGLPPIPVSVNVSAIEFRSAGFFERVVGILTDTSLDPRYLEIELTETVLMSHVERTNSVLHALKHLGVQVAIDDFGTGWSSLSYLRHFPVDALKIDKSFVQEITTHHRPAPIVSAIISMGKGLNLRVIAEGVETRDQFTFLQVDACGEGQGYYFSPPLAAPQFVGLLKQQ